MEPEQGREYDRLQRETIAKLRLHAYVDELQASHAFQYLVLPSFEPPVAWDVFRRGRAGTPEEEYLLLRTCWRSDLDEEKLRTPVERLRHPYPLAPSIEVHQLPATSAHLRELVEELAAIPVAIGADVPILGLDGTTYEVAVRQHPSGGVQCRLSWWQEPPAAWSPLRAWVRRAEQQFDAAWLARGDASPVPVTIRAVGDAAARHEAQRLFHEGHYGRVAEILAEVATRQELRPSETKMLELALARKGRPASST